MPSFSPQPVGIVLNNVLVGCCAASFWRGAWYVLDDNLYPEDPVKSSTCSLVAGTLGMLGSQGLVKRHEALSGWKRSAMRFGAIYSVAFSCILVWRGAWLGWDCFYEDVCSNKHIWHATRSSFLHHSIYEKLHTEKVSAADPGHATRSGLLSHIVACCMMVSMGVFASVLAPPANASLIRDVTVKTALSAKRKLPKRPTWRGDVRIGGISPPVATRTFSQQQKARHASWRAK